MSLRIAFLGTPDFAAAALQALLEASRHEVVCVVSQPDRRAGRGRQMVAPPVAALATARGLPLLQPQSVKTRAFRDWLGSHAPDVAVVAAYGHILGPRVLALPRLGCLNIHASLLPRWRGASPIQAALLAGDDETGVTIMQMDRGLDTGAMLWPVVVPIRVDDTGSSLHDRLAQAGAAAIVDALDHLEAGGLVARPQDDALATYAPLLRKSEGDVDWSQPAEVLDRRVRALFPWPGTRTRHGEVWLKVLPGGAPTASPAGGVPGTVLAADADGVVVACGGGTALTIRRLQAPGRKPLDAAEFLKGYPLHPGEVLS